MLGSFCLLLYLDISIFNLFCLCLHLVFATFSIVFISVIYAAPHYPIMINLLRLTKMLLTFVGYLRIIC